jgi:hypothetical protein
LIKTISHKKVYVIIEDPEKTDEAIGGPISSLLQVQPIANGTIENFLIKSLSCFMEQP